MNPGSLLPCILRSCQRRHPNRLSKTFGGRAKFEGKRERPASAVGPKPPIAILGNWPFIQGALPDEDPLSTEQYRQDDAMETTSYSRESTPVEVGADASSLLPPQLSWQARY